MAAVRPHDTVRIEVIPNEFTPGNVRRGTLDNFTSLVITNDLTQPSEAAFELGDDGTFPSVGEIFTPGINFQVYVNDIPRLRGRAEMLSVPADVQAGAVVQFTVRTKLSDAMYGSAPPKLKIVGASLEQLILQAYAPLGFAKDDFNFRGDVARSVMTGRNVDTGEVAIEPERIFLKDARVRPPESIYAFVDRHLRRHSLMHWDGPDGRIVVADPNDNQTPRFKFNMFRNAEQRDSNNVIGTTRTQDWSGVPGAIAVFGKGGGKGFARASVMSIRGDDDVVNAGFLRPVYIVAENVKTQDQADRAAARELTARRKQKDTFSLEIDGLSYWDQGRLVNYAPDTVCQIRTDVAGSNISSYYCHATTLTRNAADGDLTSMSLLKQGLWDLG